MSLEIKRQRSFAMRFQLKQDEPDAIYYNDKLQPLLMPLSYITSSHSFYGINCFLFALYYYVYI